MPKTLKRSSSPIEINLKNEASKSKQWATANNNNNDLSRPLDHNTQGVGLTLVFSFANFTVEIFDRPTDMANAPRGRQARSQGVQKTGNR